MRILSRSSLVAFAVKGDLEKQLFILILLGPSIVAIFEEILIWSTSNASHSLFASFDRLIW